MLGRLWRKWGRKGRRREVRPKWQGGMVFKGRNLVPTHGCWQGAFVLAYAKSDQGSDTQSGSIRHTRGEPTTCKCHVSGHKGTGLVLCVQVKEEGNYQVWAQGHQDNTFASRLKVRKSNFPKITSARALLEHIIRAPRVCTLGAVEQPRKLHCQSRGSQDRPQGFQTIQCILDL